VIDTLSSHLGFATLRAVLRAGRPCVDVTFMEEDPTELHALAKERGVAAVVDCGIAPGVTHLLCGRASAALDRCRRLEILVGGLPEVRRWPFEYRAGFAPRDVIEEYTRPARLVRNGKVEVREALSEIERIDLPGVGTVEAFVTDGLRSLVRTLDVPEMVEKTLRWPGHAELMRVFRHVGWFSKDPVEVGGTSVRPLDLTEALLFPHWSFDEREADVTVMRITADGERGGRETRLTWDLLDRYDPATDFRSMSRTTAYAATGVAALLLAGHAPAPGVHFPEHLGRDAAFTDAFLAEYAKRGCVVTASEA
jgi:lysine 6-dehydrogenase